MISSHARGKLDWPLVFLLLGAATYLYFNLFSFRTPILLGGDQVYFWTYAERMLDGERIYRDFFQFTPPGTDLLYLGLFKLFGLNVWVTNATVLVLGVALCWLCFAIAAEIMDRRSAVLTAVFFLVIVYGKLLNGTHHWFSVLAIMGAIKIYSGTTGPGRTMASGALLGLASFFTQTHGAVALLAFILFLALMWRRSRQPWVDLLRNEGVLLIGYTFALLLLDAYFIATIGFRQLWYFQVTFVRQYVVHASQGAYLGLPERLSWHALPSLSQYLVVYILLPVIYPLTLWRCWRQGDNTSLSSERVTLLSIVGIFLLVEVAFSMNWLRIFAVSFAGIIVLFWNASHAGMIRRSAIVFLWIGFACIAYRQTSVIYAHNRSPLRLPGGAVVVTPQASEKLQWTMMHTTPGQFFLQADGVGMYLPLRLRNPSRLDGITPGEETRPGDITGVIQQLDGKRVQFVLWRPRLDSTESSQDNLTPLRAYLHSKYTRFHVFADGDTVWERNEFIGPP
jgi:hypothetical protein